MRDYGNEETEKLLKQLEKRLTAEYSDAVRDVEAKFKDYMRRFEIKDEIKRRAVEAGVLEQKDYIKWRTSQVMVGERWQAMLDQLSADLHTTNEKAISIARGYQYDAYAINHNFATYTIESQSQINTSYTLYDRQTVERLVREDPELLPPPKPGGKTARKLAENKDLRWNRQKISSAVMQGVIQGESVPQMARRLESVGEMDHRAAIRNARTMVTGAQNAGRIDAGKRARDMGIGTTNVWMATLDMRTRHEHRELDGQRKEVDEPFVVPSSKEEIRYPGDPSAAAHLVYNCRCTLIPQVKGFEYDIRDDANMDYSGIEGMTYDEWKKDRREKPNPITLPEEKAEAAKQSYNAEYRKLRKETLAKSGESDIIDDRYHGYDRAERKALKKIDKRWQAPRYDKASDEFLDALPKLSKPATIRQSTLKANPTGDGDNCVKCITAFEAMLRGYNLEALPSYASDIFTADVYDIFAGFAFNDAVTDAPQNEIIQYLLKEGNGARAVVGARVKGSLHLFIAVNEDGNVHFCDPQKRKHDALEYFANKDEYKTFDVRYTRIDNLSFTEGIKLFTRKSRYNDIVRTSKKNRIKRP